MKKALASILSLAMMFSLLTACGGGEEAPPPEETSITDGYWVLDSMTMEGTEFTKEEIEQTFGSADQTMCLTRPTWVFCSWRPFRAAILKLRPDMIWPSWMIRPPL